MEDWKFEIGQEVNYTNGYGLDMGKRTIVEKERWDTGNRYYIEPTDTPWYPVRENQLSEIES